MLLGHTMRWERSLLDWISDTRTTEIARTEAITWDINNIASDTLVKSERATEKDV